MSQKPGIADDCGAVICDGIVVSWTVIDGEWRAFDDLGVEIPATEAIKKAVRDDRLARHKKHHDTDGDVMDDENKYAAQQRLRVMA